MNTSSPQSDNRVAPAPVSDVQAQIQHLETTIDRLDAVCLNFINQLSPVLRPANDVKSERGASPVQALPVTELARQISELNSRVRSLGESVSDAYGRLGL